MKGIKPTSYLNNMIIHTKPLSQQGGWAACVLGRRTRPFLTASSAVQRPCSFASCPRGGPSLLSESWVPGKVLGALAPVYPWGLAQVVPHSPSIYPVPSRATECI